MLRKAAVLSIAWYAIAVILSGCCNCPEAPVSKFKWTGLKITTRSYTNDSGAIHTMPDTSSDFRRYNPVLLTEMDYQLLSHGATHPAGFITQAYACKCEEKAYMPEQTIAALNVFTVNAFDADHPAMTDVSDYFKQPAYTVQGMPDGLKPLNFPIGKKSMPWPGSNYALYLDKRPTMGTEHQFKVVFTLSDSSTIEAPTSVLLF